ncbi:uncharacterized protein L969DRAFT_46709 [Mixia osmundae IAM 14324]|uniref:Protein-S-isoprenylcysteine O-methyltransferase n=1 Tax=Mixia osmundae (strain CBS 9802 / IAM 14324 / JCM 22182 / KY 12970) TaxID=764103 RepID=G7DUF0_MIXOS|nr:uncharacterized protein L969DRAFT_46709 [Mixia osmundae IAM 14324]KEI41082.1 hypothetical protein L969DRAFT_46709 [Mixia osmundae IAM 14324]GAA94210.1 hypothetical protein E5Q_00859 [Mixia osmundae IAM 14324]
MQILGIHVTPGQQVEFIAWSISTTMAIANFSSLPSSLKASTEVNGPPKDTSTGLEPLIMPLQMLVVFPTVLYPVIAPLVKRFRGPIFAEAYRLPNLPEKVDPHVQLLVRLGGGLAGMLIARVLTQSTFRELGYHLHGILVRERTSTIVDTGMYSIIRHPLYATALLWTASSSLLYWNYIPLMLSAALATVFAIKIPVEEKYILEDKLIGPKYRLYQSKVPYRMIPYIY